jgi:hypothetical protein
MHQEALDMADSKHRMGNGILGDIDPAPEPETPHSGEPVRNRDEQTPALSGGSQHDRTEHSGSRDVTEGVTGGTGTETGGSRNYRSGTGATGTDIGNRPE